MQAPRIRLTVDPSATVPLRFDDPEFIEALEADGRDVEETGDGEELKRPLARLLGVREAAAFDFESYVAAGWTLHVRPTIAGSTEDAMYSQCTRRNGEPDIEAFNAKRWALWVRGVTVDQEDAVDPADRRALAMLSNATAAQREAAFKGLPKAVRGAFLARLRVHTDERTRPADRDPGKAEPPTEDGWSPTRSNFGGDPTLRHEEPHLERGLATG